MLITVTTLNRGGVNPGAKCFGGRPRHIPATPQDQTPPPTPSRVSGRARCSHLGYITMHDSRPYDASLVAAGTSSTLEWEHTQGLRRSVVGAVAGSLNGAEEGADWGRGYMPLAQQQRLLPLCIVMQQHQEHLHVVIEANVVRRLTEYAKLKGRSLSSFVRLILGCCNWASMTEDHAVLPIPKALTHDHELLRAALLEGVDRIVEHYRSVN